MRNPEEERERGDGPYPSGTAAFDRVVFFTDAIFAISITLAAVTIGVPEINGPVTDSSLWQALQDKSKNLLAFAFTFIWVAFYWRANHKFTHRLAEIDGRYIGTLLLYLAFIALLPVATGTLGEYANAVALSLFLVTVAIISSLEVVLLTVAWRDRLLAEEPNRIAYRKEAISSLVPVAIALLSIPIAFLSVPIAFLFMGVGSVSLGLLVDRVVPGG
ncbi:MAG: TMEM175 family protein [Solirubrobacterales bacterium]